MLESLLNANVDTSLLGEKSKTDLVNIRFNYTDKNDTADGVVPTILTIVPTKLEKLTKSELRNI